jgi:hypothetical protein
VNDYVAPDGLRVVGSKLPFARLQWTLVVEEDYDTAFAPIASILGRTLTLNLVIVGVLSALAFGFAAYVVPAARPVRGRDPAARRRARRRPAGRHRRRTSRHPHAQLRRDGQSLARARESLEQLATTDGLTKIHNHRFFQDRLTAEGGAQRARRRRSPCCSWTSTTSRR